MSSVGRTVLRHPGFHRIGGGLFEDRPQQVGHPGRGGSRDLGEQVPRIALRIAMRRALLADGVSPTGQEVADSIAVP